MVRWRAIVVGLLALLVFPGALPPDAHRVHPDFERRFAIVRTLGLVDPVVDAYELGAGGTHTPRPDWSEVGRRGLREAVERELTRRGYSVKRVQLTEPAERAELRDARLLYEAAALAIIQATILNEFPWKLHRFEYTVGEVARLTAAVGVDALAFVQCTAHIASASGVLPLAGAVGGVDWLTVGIVDGAGDVLWFSFVSSTVSDVRDPLSTAAFVYSAIAPLPRRARRP